VNVAHIQYMHIHVHIQYTDIHLYIQSHENTCTYTYTCFLMRAGTLRLYSTQPESGGESRNELLAVPLLHPKASSVLHMSHYGEAGQFIHCI
jgi:hypothetical protein